MCVYASVCVSMSSFDPLATISETLQGSSNNVDYSVLRRAWMNEMFCPELLAYETEAVANLMKCLPPQWDLVGARQWGSRDTYIRDILVMEADRVGYVLKSYLRARMCKIQKYTRYYIGLPHLLSPGELKFAHHLVGITEQAFQSMFLRHLPPDDEYFQTLVSSDDPGGDMIRKPDMDAVVFVQVTDHIGSIRTGPDETADLVKDHSYMIKYDLVKEFLRDNRLHLI